MDKLIENGTAFIRASCLGGKHEALCVVSRAGIKTGRYMNSLLGGADVIPPEQIVMPNICIKTVTKPSPQASGITIENHMSERLMKRIIFF